VKKLWKVLVEKESHTPAEARVLFSRQAKGRQRLYINHPAATLMGLADGARVELLSSPDARPVLGLNLSKDGVLVRSYKSSKSLIVTTGAIDHLKKAYKRIHYRPRVGVSMDGDPAFVLEPLSSEKDPLP